MITRTVLGCFLIAAGVMVGVTCPGTDSVSASTRAEFGALLAGACDCKVSTAVAGCTPDDYSLECAYPEPCPIATYCTDDTPSKYCRVELFGSCTELPLYTCTNGIMTTGPCQWAVFSPGLCMHISVTEACSGSAADCV